jgi:hypothetical protein
MDIKMQKNIITKLIKIKNNMEKDLIDYIMDYESGELSDKDTLEMFSNMIKTGAAWSLQGHYGRTASSLIEDGWLDRKGNILKELE